MGDLSEQSLESRGGLGHSMTRENFLLRLPCQRSSSSGVASQRATALQITLYVVLLIAMAWLPLAAGYGGVAFGVVATLLGLRWLQKSLPLFVKPSYEQTLAAYKHSIVYLAGVFLALAVEPALPWY